MNDTPANRKLVKCVFREQIKKRGISDFLDEMVAHWLSWEKLKDYAKSIQATGD